MSDLEQDISDQSSNLRHETPDQTPENVLLQTISDDIRFIRNKLPRNWTDAKVYEVSTQLETASETFKLHTDKLKEEQLTLREEYDTLREERHTLRAHDKKLVEKTSKTEGLIEKLESEIAKTEDAIENSRRLGIAFKNEALALSRQTTNWTDHLKLDVETEVTKLTQTATDSSLLLSNLNQTVEDAKIQISKLEKISPLVEGKLSETVEDAKTQASKLEKIPSLVEQKLSETVNDHNSNLSNTATALKTTIVDKLSKLDEAIEDAKTQASKLEKIPHLVEGKLSETVSSHTSSLSNTAMTLETGIEEKLSKLTGAIEDARTQASKLEKIPALIEKKLSETIDNHTSSLGKTVTALETNIEKKLLELDKTLTQLKGTVREQLETPLSGLSACVDKLDRVPETLQTVVEQSLSEVMANLSSSVQRLVQTPTELSKTMGGRLDRYAAGISSLSTQVQQSMGHIQTAAKNLDQTNSDIVSTNTSFHDTIRKEADELMQQIPNQIDTKLGRLDVEVAKLLGLQSQLNSTIDTRLANFSKDQADKLTQSQAQLDSTLDVKLANFSKDQADKLTQSQAQLDSTLDVKLANFGKDQADKLAQSQAQLNSLDTRLANFNDGQATRLDSLSTALGTKLEEAIGTIQTGIHDQLERKLNDMEQTIERKLVSSHASQTRRSEELVADTEVDRPRKPLTMPRPILKPTPSASHITVSSQTSSSDLTDLSEDETPRTQTSSTRISIQTPKGSSQTSSQTAVQTTSQTARKRSASEAFSPTRNSGAPLPVNQLPALKQRQLPRIIEVFIGGSVLRGLDGAD
ncbi:MAG: hypothetical protein M1820_010116 [Bogoriella megaspora]|nr:MAG: hypothetical protein M1820_010116 [Bogoriella megaspora]